MQTDVDLIETEKEKNHKFQFFVTPKKHNGQLLENMTNFFIFGAVVSLFALKLSVSSMLYKDTETVTAQIMSCSGTVPITCMASPLKFKHTTIKETVEPVYID